MNYLDCDNGDKSHVLKVDSLLTATGFTVKANRRSYKVVYPPAVWTSISRETRLQLAQSTAFLFTRHLPFLKMRSIAYIFPAPVIQSFFIHGFLFSLPEAAVENPQMNHKISDLLKTLFESEKNITFNGHYRYRIPSEKSIDRNKAVVLFSFGKDSLLSYGLLKEIGIEPKLYLFSEPFSPVEMKHKLELLNLFNIEHKTRVFIFKNKLGLLRQQDGEMWGWDMLLLGYLLLLIPFIVAEKTAYLVFSNESSTDEWIKMKEGFCVNTTYEQSSVWMQNLNCIPELFSSGAQITSIIKPLNELVILYILNHRYPQIAKYQLSCDHNKSTKKSDRWCGQCYECARIYLYLHACGVSPKSVGFKKSMFDMEKKEHFLIFKEKPKGKSGIKDFFCRYQERLLAFYLAYKRGVKGDVMELFKESFLQLVEENKNFLLEKYFTLSSDQIMPEELKKKVLPIYETEISYFKKEIKSFF